MAQDNASAEFILANASRLVTVATRCAFSFGSADGLNDLLLEVDDPHGEWRHTVSVCHRDLIMMSVLRVSTLLDRNDVSFQAVHHRLDEPGLVAALLHVLDERHGPDVTTPSRTELIDEFRDIYREIDWKVYGRLLHFRNLGIAHLTPEEMSKSITFPELRTLVEIVSRLAANLQHLCHTPTAFRTNIPKDYRQMALRTMSPKKA